MRKLYQILYNVGRLTDAPGGGRFLSRGDTLAWAGLREGEALGVSEGHRKPETYRTNLYDQYKFCASQSVLLKTE